MKGSYCGDYWLRLSTVFMVTMICIVGYYLGYGTRTAEREDQ